MATLDYPDAMTVDLVLSAQLGLSGGFNNNQQSMVDALNGFFNGGGTLTPELTTLFGLTGGDLTGALDELSPEIYNEQRTGSLYASDRFAGDMMSCPIADTGAVLREGACVWARARGRELTDRRQLQPDRRGGGYRLRLRRRAAYARRGLAARPRRRLRRDPPLRRRQRAKATASAPMSAAC